MSFSLDLLISAEEGISDLTALLEVHLVPQDKLGVAKGECEGQQKLVPHEGPQAATPATPKAAVSGDAQSAL